MECLSQRRCVTVALLVYGLPASGKSTVVQRLRAMLHPSPMKVIEFDDLLDDITERNGLAGHFQPVLWHETFKKFIERWSSLIEEAAVDVESTVPPVIIAIDNSFYKSMRFPLLRAVETVNGTGGSVIFISVYFSCALDICLTRNRSRDPRRQVPEASIQRIVACMEVGPVKRQHPETHFTVDAAMDADRVLQNLRDIIERVRRDANHDFFPRPPLVPEERRQEAQSSDTEAHRLDILLRQMVSRLMQTVAGEEITLRQKHQLGEALADARKQLQQSARKMCLVQHSLDDVEAFLAQASAALERLVWSFKQSDA